MALRVHNCTNPKTGKLCPGFKEKSKAICLIEKNLGEVKKPWFCPTFSKHIPLQRDGAKISA